MKITFEAKEIGTGKIIKGNYVIGDDWNHYILTFFCPDQLLDSEYHRIDITTLKIIVEEN